MQKKQFSPSPLMLPLLSWAALAMDEQPPELPCCPYRAGSDLFPCPITFVLFHVPKQELNEKMLLEAVEK